jgi:hypothetical protein
MIVVEPFLSAWRKTKARMAAVASGGDGVILPLNGAAKLM